MMKSGSRETIPTVAEVVRDAAEICDPDGAESAVDSLVTTIEDDDRPTTASENLTGELLDALRGIDPDGDDPAAAAAAATAAWLATNPGDTDGGAHAVREGVRFVFKGDPPPPLADWLA